MVKRFVTGWNEKNAEKLASIFVENAEFVNVTGLWWHSRDRIFKAHDYGLKVIFQRSDLEIIRMKKRTLTEKVAIIHAKMRLVRQTPMEEGKTPQPRNNILLFCGTKDRRRLGLPGSAKHRNFGGKRNIYREQRRCSRSGELW